MSREGPLLALLPWPTRALIFKGRRKRFEGYEDFIFGTSSIMGCVNNPDFPVSQGAQTLIRLRAFNFLPWTAAGVNYKISTDLRFGNDIAARQRSSPQARGTEPQI